MRGLIAFAAVVAAFVAAVLVAQCRAQEHERCDVSSDCDKDLYCWRGSCRTYEDKMRERNAASAKPLPVLVAPRSDEQREQTETEIRAAREQARPKPRKKAKPAPVGRTCCKVCRKGKPCGDSCIAANRSCHKGPGCAC